MFTKNQMEYLSRVQATYDWDCSYFVKVLRQFHEDRDNPFIDEAHLPQAEFEELMLILSKASTEDIWNLQMGLNYLNELPYRMFHTGAQIATT